MKYVYLLMLTTLSIIVFSCTKKSTSSESNSEYQANDQSQFESSIAGANDLVETNIEGSATFLGLKQDAPTYNSLTAEITVTSTQRKVVLHFTGDDYKNRFIVSGDVTITTTPDTRWRNANAAVTVSYSNFSMTRKSDNKKIILNGTVTYTNVSGGLLANLATLGSITRTQTGTLQVTFDDGTSRSWQLARQLVYSYNSGNTTVSITGTHTSGNLTNIVTWGTTRKGEEFTTQITSPIVIDKSCLFRVTSGTQVITTSAYTATTTYGLDASGNPTTCPASGSYYFKLIVVANSKTYTYIKPY